MRRSDPERLIRRSGRVFAVIAALCAPPAGAAEPAPFTVAPGLFDPTAPDTLGLEPAPGIETATIFRGTIERAGPGGAYNHGVVLLPFRGRLYAQWQSSARDEDAPDTAVLYAHSPDGMNWSQPKVLARSSDGVRRSNGGWWTDGETLAAYIVDWAESGDERRAGVTHYRLSENGNDWMPAKPVLDRHGAPVDGIIEQDPHRLPGGRVVSAFHENPGLRLAPWYTDDTLAISGWSRGRMPNLPYAGADTSREIEPSWYLRSDGAIVMVMRDQASSFRTLAALSRDHGVSWTAPVKTGMPDSRSKQSAGNLPDGTAYLVGNPTGDRRRHPLAIALSRDGFFFDRAWLLRAGGDHVPRLRHPGRFKRSGYSYPKSVIWNDWLYVAYATNKEDAELSRIPLQSLASTPASAQD